MKPVVWHLGSRSAELAARVSDALEGATIAGPKTRDLREAFVHGRPVIALASTGIVVRILAPLLADKRSEPPVVVVDEAGRFVIPLLGGHRGANALAGRLAERLDARAIVTTAGDARFGLALDAPPPGWRLADPEAAKPFTGRLLEGATCRLVDERGLARWLEGGNLPLAADGELVLEITHERRASNRDRLVYHPAVLALGVGCERGAPPAELAALTAATLEEAGLAPEAVACVVSATLKAAEPAVHALARDLGVPARFLGHEALAAEAPRLLTPSAVVEAEIGIPGVAEAAALAAVGASGELIVAKRKSRRCTCAVALASSVLDPARIGRSRGRLTVLGIGPGDAASRTAAVEAALARAELVVGYGLYLDLVADLTAHAEKRAYPLGLERQRCADAIAEAARGRRVALVSSGDPGIYAMATLVMELLERSRNEAEERIEVVVLPGVSALQVAAARAGAPLGHDFAAISLSDLLTPMPVIEARLEAAARGDFALALYNPVSRRRRTALATARRILLAHRSPETPVVIARNLGREGETVEATTLDELGADRVDMLSIVLVGAQATRRFARVTGETWTYTPRGYEMAAAEGGE